MRTGMLLMLALGLWSCAIPRPPSGGPVDRTPPRLIESDPTPGATRVRTNRIRLTFSEYLDRKSFQQALSIFPEPDTLPTVRWKGRTVELVFPEPLRPNTTYIITLDTELRDWHGVRLKAPIVLAFSTGAVLHNARLQGEVRQSWSDAPAAHVDVFLYGALPRSWKAIRPLYRTQTDDRGRFVLNHLPDTTFFVVVLADRNRNRLPDPGEPFAPPPEPLLRATTEPAPTYRWYLTRLDTLPPVLRFVRSLSRQRIETRFSEPVRLASRDPASWSLFHTRSRTGRSVLSVYQQETPSTRVFLLTEPLEADSFTLAPAGIVDTAGNPTAAEARTFMASASVDTFVNRFRGFLPSVPFGREGDIYVLSPHTPPGVRWLLPADTTTFDDRLRVRDARKQPIPYRYTSPDGTTFYLYFPPPEGSFSVEVHMPDTTYVRLFRYLTPEEQGSLILPVRYSGPAAPLRAVLMALDPGRLSHPIILPLTAYREARFERLPEGRYRIYAFADTSDNGQWDGGRLLPYARPEPLAWLTDTLRVRPRWEIVTDTLVLTHSPSLP